MLKSILVILLFSICFFSEATSKSLVACIDEHPPYQYLAEIPYGKHISALRILADVLNKELTFVRSPNIARCLSFLNTGYVDVIAGLNITKERSKFTFYAPFKLADGLTAISRKNMTINEYSDLADKIIGVPRGATYFAKFDNDDTLNKVSIQNEVVGLSMILKQRIDLILANENILEMGQEGSNYNALKASKIELGEDFSKVTYFGFSMKNKLEMSQQEIISAVQEAVKKGRFILSEDTPVQAFDKP